MTNHRLLTLSGALILLLAACSGAATPTATPTRPAATAQPTATPQAGAATATPTPKPAPTVAPAAGPKTGGTLRMTADPREPRGWDRWSIKTGANEVDVRSSLNFNMLVTYRASLDKPCQPALSPELAESWKWVDDRTLELKLVQGVKFQNKAPVNGREMTATDAAWSATRFLKEDPIRGMDALAPNINKIEATDRYTVRFSLASPGPTILTEGLTSYFGALVVPKEVTDEKGRWTDPNKSYVGTGPFTFKEHILGTRTSFVKHADYFKKGLPYLDRVDILIVPDISTQVAGLRSGALDMVYGPVPSPMALPLKKAPGITVVSCPQMSSPDGIIGFRADKPPFNDVRVRRAVQMSLDREGMLKSILQGEGMTAPHIPQAISPTYVGWEDLPQDAAQWVKYDPKRASALLSEAGYSKGLDIGIKFNTGYRTPYPEMAEALVGFLQAIGVNAKPHYVPATEFASFIASGDFGEDSMYLGRQGVLFLPTEAFSRWNGKMPPNSNRSRISDPELDKMIEQLLRETDEAKFTQLYRKMEARLIDQAWEPLIGVFPNQFNALRDNVKGFAGPVVSYSSTYLERMWLDK